MLKKLYVRIWLAVVLAVAVLTFLVGWAWRMAADPPLRDVVIRNEAGQIIGSGHSRRMRGPPGTTRGWSRSWTAPVASPLSTAARGASSPSRE